MWDSWRWSHHGSWLAGACLRSAPAVLSTDAVAAASRTAEDARLARQRRRLIAASRSMLHLSRRGNTSRPALSAILLGLIPSNLVCCDCERRAVGTAAGWQ